MHVILRPAAAAAEVSVPLLALLINLEGQTGEALHIIAASEQKDIFVKG